MLGFSWLPMNGEVEMEIVIVIIFTVVVISVLITLLSSPETKLFRRVWSSERTGAYSAQGPAIDALLEQFGISIPSVGSTPDELDRLGDGIGRLMAKSVEFDARHKNNLGVIVTNVVASNLKQRLNAAGISIFDDQLEAMTSFDPANMARALDNALR